MEADDYAAIAADVGVTIFGAPNRRLSTSRDLRWGTHGSLSLSVATGQWYDHEACIGGGVLDLIVHAGQARTRAEAAAWIEERYGAGDRSAQPASREGAARAPKGNGSAGQKYEIAAEYVYRSADGAPVFEVVRLLPKTFRQRRWCDGRWVWGVDGVDVRIPYRLPEVLAAPGAIFVVEGEKDADMLWAAGVPATTNAGGARKWTGKHAEYLRDRVVYVIPDADEPGRDHAEMVAETLHGIAREVRIVALEGLAEHGDVSDWIEAGHSVAELLRLAAAAPIWQWAPRAKTVCEPARWPVVSEDVWGAYPLLGELRRHARGLGAAPDAMLGALLAAAGGAAPRDAGTTPRGPHAPATRLGLFVVIVGESGAGKTSATAAARRIWREWPDTGAAMDMPIGSGEGIAEMYMGEVAAQKEDGAEVKLRQQVRYSALAMADEGEALLRLVRRDGATLGETLRRAYTGEPLGARNACAERTRVVRDAALSLIVHATPAVAAALVEHAEVGLPQRFLWFAAHDPGADAAAPWAPPPDIPPLPAIAISVDPAITRRLREERAAVLRGEAELDELDAHAVLIVSRVAAILTGWDGREHVTTRDWAMAESIVGTSRAVREMTIQLAGERQTAAAAARGTQRGIEAGVARAVAEDVEGSLERVARVMARQAARRPMTRRELRDCVASRDRGLFAAALEWAEGHGLVERTGEKTWRAAGEPP